MAFTNFTFDVDADGIALVTWNMPGRSMNVIDAKVMEELEAIVEKVASDAAIKGAVITSGKDTFCAGADLTMLEILSREFADVVVVIGLAFFQLIPDFCRVQTGSKNKTVSMPNHQS